MSPRCPQGVPGVVASSRGRAVGLGLGPGWEGALRRAPGGGRGLCPTERPWGLLRGVGCAASSLRGKGVEKKTFFFFLFISRSSNLRKTLPFLIRRLKDHEGVLTVAVFKSSFLIDVGYREVLTGFCFLFSPGANRKVYARVGS